MSELLSIIQKNNPSPYEFKSDLGRRGEFLAAEYLIANGYRLVLANFKFPIGRNSKGAQITGEIDIVALDAETLCFVEVKTRRSDEFTPIITNVDRRKQRQIIRTARIYRRTFHVFDMAFRFDVVTMLIPKHAEPQIDLSKGFWSEAKFRKRRWDQESWRELP